ncbi:MAG: hypothetical protein GF311_05235 [Candidatus Lokiarchaeota archaeon]|nr:hypothetical protein [Candidatus Lokiarchaeota archaeon]
MKRRYLLIFALLVSIFWLDIPSARADPPLNYSLTINKSIFYPNETLNINGSWQIYRDQGEEGSYAQFRIYNNSEYNEDTNYFLIWNSSEYHEEGNVSKSENVSIQTLLDKCTFDGLINLYVILHFYLANSRFVFYEFQLCEKQITILEQEGAVELYNISTNKENFLPNETIEIETEWSLSYITPEISHIQLQIHNALPFGSESLLWESEFINTTGYVERSFMIVISNITNSPVKIPVQLYLTVYYFHTDINNVSNSLCLSYVIIGLSPFNSPSLYNQGDPLLSILLPSGIGIGVAILGVVIYLNKRNKTKEVEEITIQF